MVNSSMSRSIVLGQLTTRSSARKRYSIRHGDSRGQVEKIAYYDSPGIVTIVHIQALEAVMCIKHCAMILKLTRARVV